MKTLDELEAEIAKEEAAQAVLKLRLDAINDRLEKLRKKFQQLCQHEETVDKSSYFSGSYYDRASTMHNLQCTRCHKIVRSWDEVHNRYG